MSAVYQLSWSPYTNCPGGFNRYELSGSNAYSYSTSNHGESSVEVVVNEGEYVTFNLVAVDNYGQASDPATVSFTADTNTTPPPPPPSRPDMPSGFSYSFVRFQ